MIALIAAIPCAFILGRFVDALAPRASSQVSSWDDVIRHVREGLSTDDAIAVANLSARWAARGGR